jgi:hypothetical protein
MTRPRLAACPAGFFAFGPRPTSVDFPATIRRTYGARWETSKSRRCGLNRHSRSWHQTAQFDPHETFTTRRRASRFAESGRSDRVRPSGNDLRLKRPAAVARLAILGWEGATRACPSGRAHVPSVN